MSAKTGRTGLYVPTFPPRKAKKIAGTGKMRGTKVRLANPPSVEPLSTSMYRQGKKK